MWQRSWTLSIFLATFLLAACGGGSFHMHNPSEPPALMQPQVLIQKIEASMGNDSAVDSLLAGLARRDAFRFDWRMFWKELSVRSFREPLYERHHARLVELSTYHCDAFPEFTEFLLASKGDLEIIVGKDRACYQPLPPAIVAAVMDAVFEKLDSESKTLMVDSLHFLKGEVENGSRSYVWSSTFESRQDKIAAIGRKAVEKGEATAYIDTVVTMREKIGTSSYPKSFFLDLISQRTLFDTWLAQEGLKNGLALAQSFLEDLGKEYIASEADVENVTAAIETEFLKDAEAEVRGEGLALALPLLKTLTKGYPISARVTPLDRLLKTAEAAIGKESHQAQEELLFDWTTRFGHPSVAPYFHWLAFRFSDPNGKLVAALLDAVLAKEESSWDDVDKLIRNVNKLYLLENKQHQEWLLTETKIERIGQEGQRLKNEACQRLAQHRVLEETIEEGELKLALEEGLPPGCYRLKSDKAVTIHSDRPLHSTFASLLLFDDHDLTFEAPTVSLGPVYLEMTKQLERLEQTPTPPSANAVGFPVLLGFVLDHPTYYFGEGTHFFFYHHTLHDADAGQPEPKKPATGFSGPLLHLALEAESPRFPFASCGGKGQPGAYPRKGGQSDKSFFDFEHLKDWILAKIDAGNLVVPGVPHVESALSLEVLEDLVNNAVRNDDGEIQLETAPGYFVELPLEQQNKITEACKALLSKDKLADKDIDRCYKDTFAKNSISVLNKLLVETKKDGRIRRDVKLPFLEPTKDFYLREGRLGPLNPDGAQGLDGELKIKVKGSEGEVVP